MKKPTKKQLEKDLKEETRVVNNWLKEINRFAKLPDDEYKFRQLDNAVRAVYTGYNNLSAILRAYKP